ncbi:MAG: dethiobiotin synthetase [Chloroflexota bacterium]|nr:dethiobiotin synthetase [Chloroflexota bacterium]
MTGIMVYGTDTGVGKTVVTAGLVAAALDAGLTVRALKPVQTGAAEDDDGAEVNRLAGAEVARTGWRLRDPLAPAVAARREGRRLSPKAVVAWVERAAAEADVALVETAGGVAVEITRGWDMAALGAALGYPALLVCRPGLGTLNHTLLSVEHLRAAGVVVVGLVVSGAVPAPGLAEATNLAELPRLTRTPLVAVVPLVRLRGHAARAALADALHDALIAASG